MPSIPNGKLLFNEIPEGFPEPGKTTVYDKSESIDLDNINLHAGEILLKTVALSVDPYMRGRMRPVDVPSYAPAFPLHEPVTGHGIATVVKSNNSQYKPNDHVYGTLPFEDYAKGKPESWSLKILENKEKIPWTVYLGAAGMPGQTAYYGWQEYGPKEKGGVAFVSTGAGPVGSFVIQLAKKNGMKVIGSAGSAEKVNFMKQCGADVAFNYKETSTEDILRQEGPVNFYWDNVGGETLDAVLSNSAIGATIVACGMITVYNDSDAAYPYKNMMQLFARQLHIHGLLVFPLAAKYEKEFYATVPGWISNGDIKYKEEVTEGLENGGHVILDVQKGRNKAKAVVLVSKDEDYGKKGLRSNI